jgi:hypothetical protein
MRTYLLSIMQPEGEPPPPEVLEPVMAELAALTREMKAADVWVFDAPLHPPSTATVVRARGDEILVTDGPYLEGTEFVGGFTIVRAADLDAALGWAERLARILTLPIEVRPVVAPT